MCAESRNSGNNKDPSLELEGTDQFKTYLEYNKVLRTWFVAFGIGGPALLLLNPDLAARLSRAGSLRTVAGLLLLGAAAQIFGALINKIANWYVYFGSIDDHFKSKRRYKFARKLVTQFWIDVLLDVVTVLTFGAATRKMLAVLS